ncbi:hypothetical protein ACC691_36985, partial [Rhizobium johnstonii]
MSRFSRFSGWRAAFGVLAGVCALTVLLVALLLPAVAGGGAAHDQERGARRVRLGIVTTTNAVVYLGQYTVYTYISVLLLAAGLTAAGIGPVLLALGGLGLLGTWFAAV